MRAQSTALREARAALDDDRYADAEELVTRALAAGSADEVMLKITLADVLMEADREAEAESILRELEGSDAVRSDPHVSVEFCLSCANLAASRGEEPRAQELSEKGLAAAKALQDARLEAIALELLANRLAEADRPKREPLLRQALALVETLPDQIVWRIRLLVRMADLRRLEQDFGTSEKLLVEARDAAVQLRTAHPVNASVLRALGILRQDQARFGDAESYLREALSLMREAHGPRYSGTGRLAEHLARLLIDLNSYEDADKLLDEAQGIADAVDGPDHPTNWGLLKTRAELRTHQGRYREAEQLYAQALRHAQARRGPDSLEILGLLKGAAILARDQHQTERARALFADARPILERHRSGQSADVASFFAYLGDALNQEEKYVEAEEELDKAISIYNRIVGPEHHWTLRVRVHRAFAVSNQEGRETEAEREYAQLLSALTGVVGPEHEDVGWLLRNIGELYVYTGRWSDALPFLVRALGIYEQARGVDHPFVVWPLRLIGLSHLGAKRYDDAIRAWERALRVLEARHDEAEALREELSSLYERVGRTLDADALRERGKNTASRRSRLS
jgi:tetratricopeptide (TPR) repeat protein